MSNRRFRFGVVAGNASSAQAWTATARRAEELGYDTLLVPDTLETLSPFPALAAAATATRTLRVGTYVLSVPNRTPRAVAWEAASLSALTDRRFELGLGGGRPGAANDAARLGVRFGTPGERVQRLADTIRAARDASPHLPILVAASGPRVLRLAAREADIVALGVPPQTPEDGLAAKVDQLRELAGPRFDDLEVAANLAAVVERLEDLPNWLARQVGGDPRVIAAVGGTAFLVGKPTEMADILRRRRDALGISYITVNGMFVEQLAPVVERLAGN